MDETDNEPISLESSRRNKSRHTNASSGRSLAQGVDKETFNAKALAFMAVRDGLGFTISLKDYSDGEEIVKATPRQWGAWRAYRKRLGIKVQFMDQRAAAGAKFTVPAEWPHLFDVNASVADDFAAGDAFLRNHRPEQPHFASKAERLAQVIAFKARTPKDRKGPDTPSDQMDPTKRPAIDISDFPDRFPAA